MQIIAEAGFEAPETLKSSVIEVPREVLEQNLSAADLAAYDASDMQVLSVTVRGVKPVS